MSLKKLILPHFLIAELYGNSLVEPGAPFASPAPAAPGGPPQVNEAATLDSKNELRYKFLGKNQKQVTILARYPDDPYIPEDHLQFLIKILSACKLDLGDVAIINQGVAPVAIAKLKTELNPLAVLLFDVQPGDIGLPLNFPALKPQTFSGTNYLCIPAISLLLEENEKAKTSKKQLWDCLKKMFLA